jgi:integrase
LNAILFLYRDVLKCTLPWLEGVQRAKKPQRLPVVLTRDEVRALLAQMQGTSWLMAALVYGGGLRLMECLSLRVKDIDLEYRQLVIRDAKASDSGRRAKAAIAAERSATDCNRLRPRNQEANENRGARHLLLHIGESFGACGCGCRRVSAMLSRRTFQFE